MCKQGFAQEMTRPSAFFPMRAKEYRCESCTHLPLLSWRKLTTPCLSCIWDLTPRMFILHMTDGLPALALALQS